MDYYYLSICDSQINEFDTLFSSFCDSLNTAATGYAEIINRVLNEGVISGKIHDSLLEFNQYVKQFTDITSDLGARFHSILPKMLKEIEEADSYLYDAGITTNQRDFTQELYDRLQEYLAKELGEAGSTFINWIGGKFLDFLDLLAGPGSVSMSRAALQKDLNKLMAFNKETSLGLKVLFDSVHAIDRRYSFILSMFSSIMKETGSLLYEMASVADPKNKGGFSSGNVKKIGKAIIQLDEHHKKIVEAIKADAIPTPEMVLAFIADLDNPGFSAFNFVGTQFYNKYIVDSSGWTQFWIGFFNFEKIDKDLLSAGIKQQLGKDITYEEFLELKQMSDTLDSLKSGKQDYEKLSEESREYLKSIKKALGEAGDTTESIYKYMNKYRLEDGSLLLDGRTKEGKRMKEFLGQIKNIEKIAKYGDNALGYMSIFFADYNQQMDYIESMERNANGDPKALKMIGNLKKIYSDRWAAVVDKGMDDVADMGYDAGMKALNKAYPLLGTVTEVINIVGDSTGIGVRYGSAYEAMQMETVCNSSNRLYKNAVDKIRQMSPNDPGYALATQDLVNSFELHKANMKKMYIKMASSMEGREKAYYQYCAQQVSSIRIQDGTQPQIMSYSEFVKTDPYQGPTEVNLWDNINYDDDYRLGDFK